MASQPPPLTSEATRQRAVRFALTLTENSLLTPDEYERMLLDRFIRGELTIDQVLVQLTTREHK